MNKKVVKFALTKSQKKKVKRIHDIDCDTIELQVDDIPKIGGGVKSLLDPRKRNLTLNKEQIEMIKEDYPRPPKSIVIKPNIDPSILYEVSPPDNLDEQVPEGLKKYLDEI